MGAVDYRPSLIFQPFTLTPTTSTLSANSLSVIQGQSVTLSATVTGSGGTPSGIVTFKDGSTSLATATLNAGVATFASSSFAVGTHSLTVVYAGDGTYATSTSSAQSLVVAARTSTTTALTQSLASFAVGQTVTYTASVTGSGGTPSGTVAFLDGSTTLAAAALTGGVATFTSSSLAAGNHHVSAAYGGDSSFNVSTSSTITTSVYYSTAVTQTLSTSPVLLNQSLTITTSVASPSGLTPTGSVTYYDSITHVTLAIVNVDGTGTATYTTSTLGVGYHVVLATFYGTNSFATSSANSSFNVLAPSAAALTLGTNALYYGQTTTLAATISGSYATPTGQARLYDGATLLSTVSLSGGACTFTCPTFAAGTHSLTVVYGGDGNYAASTSSAQSLTVTARTNTTTTLTQSPASFTFGQTVTYSASVTGSGGSGGTPTGTVTFLDGSTTLGTVLLTGGIASYTSSALAPGHHYISAVYGADSNFNASTSATISPVVQYATATALTLSSSPASYNQPLTLIASVTSPSGNTPSGTVLFYDTATHSTLATVSVDGSGMATFTTSTLSVGNHSFTANFSGSSYFQYSGTFGAVNVVAPSATTLTLGSNALNYGQTTTLAATVSGSYATPTGQARLYDGATLLSTVSLSGGACTFTCPTFAAGTHSLTVVYGGDSNYAASTSSVQSLVITALSSSTALSLSTSSSTFTQNVTLTATASGASGTPSGTISFYDGAAFLGSNIVNGSGQATFSSATFNAGTHSFTAVYSGSFKYAASTSSAHSLTVAQAATGTNLTLDHYTISYGQSATATATVTVTVTSETGPATGTIIFYDAATQLPGTYTLAAGQAQATFNSFTTGAHPLTAAYSGDANNLASTSNTAYLNVNVAATTTTLTASNNNPYYHQSGGVTFVATVAGTVTNPTGTVTFYNGSTSLQCATLTLGQATFNATALSIGEHAIYAQYGGDPNYGASSSASQDVSVTQIPTSIAVTQNPSSIQFGQSVTFTATVASPIDTPSGTIVFLLDGATVGTSSLDAGQATFTSSSLAAGAHDLTSEYLGDTTHAVSSADTEFAVQQATTTTTVTSSPGTPVFGGDPVTLLATVTSNVAGAGGIPSGSLTFFDGATSLGTANLTSGVATLAGLNLSAGTHAITASYAGDSGSQFAASSGTTQLVVAQATTATTVNANFNYLTLGQTVTFLATVVGSASTTPSGTVSFQDASAGTTLGTSAVHSDGIATLAVSGLSAGSHSIVAVYSGDTNFSGGSSGAIDQIVNPAVVTGEVPLSASQTIPGTNVNGSILSTARGDFNGDGAVDLATLFNSYDSNDIELAVSLNHGDGTFASSTITHLVTPPESGIGGFGNLNLMTAGDFNGDGKTDLAVIGTDHAFGKDYWGNPSHAYVLLGHGDGAFTIPGFSDSEGTYFMGSPTAITAGNLNGDGRADLVVSGTWYVSHDGSSHQQTYVMLGQADGSLSNPVQTLGVAGNQLILADVNHDGIPDLVIPETTAGLRIAYGVGNGTFINQITLSGTTDGQVTSAAVGDFNGDGLMDLAYIKESTVLDANGYPTNIESVHILDGQANGTFASDTEIYQNSQSIYYGYSGWLKAAEFTGDGRSQLLFASQDGSVGLFIGKNDQSFDFQSINGLYVGGYGSGDPFMIGDWNVDGFDDLVVQGYSGLTSILANPGISAGGVHFVSEGSTTTLAGNAADGSGYVWDTNYNGTFSPDATGQSVTFDASNLSGPSNHFVALQATNAQGQTKIVTALVHVSHVPPTLTVTGDATVNQGAAYTLNLGATEVNNLHAVTGWIIDWGDGCTDQITGDPSTATHIYIFGDNYQIHASASDDQGTYAASAFAVTVNNAATPPSITGIPDVGSEGTPIQLASSATVGGSSTPLTYAWSVANADNTQTFSGSNSTLTFIPTVSGDFTASLTIADFKGHSSTSTSTFSVIRAVPDLRLSGTSSDYVSQTASFDVQIFPNSALGDASGTVTFFDGSVSIGTGGFNSANHDPVELQISTLAAGTHNISASYSGDAHYSDAVSSSQAFVVNFVPPATTLTLSAGTTSYGQNVVLTALVRSAILGITATPSGGVTFMDGSATLGTGTLGAAGTTTFATTTLAYGVHSLWVSYVGDSTFGSGDSADVTQIVRYPTTTTVNISANPASFSQSISLIASVTSAYGTPSGNVFFFDGTTLLGSGSIFGSGEATLATSVLSVQTHAIKAVYAGDTLFLNGGSDQASLVINKTPTTITLGSDASSAVIVGTYITFAATVSTGFGQPTGSVTFFDNSSVSLGTATIKNGVAVFTTSTLTGGTHSVAAQFNANDDFLGSSSTPLTQVLSEYSSTTSLVLSKYQSTSGQPVTLTASVASDNGIPSGHVDFYDETTWIGSSPLKLAGLSTFVTSSLSLGSHSITAQYSGDSQFANSESAGATLSVKNASTTIVTATPTLSTLGQSVVLLATVSVAGVSPGGTVSFTDGTQTLGTASLGTATSDGYGIATFAIATLAVGSHSLGASYSGDSDFDVSISTSLVETVKYSTSTAITFSANPASFGQSVTLLASVTSSGGVPRGVVVFWEGGISLGTGALNSLGRASLTTSSLSLGGHSIDAQYIGVATFMNSESDSLLLAVEKPSTTTLSSSSSSSLSAFNQTVTLSATVAGSGGTPTGTVTFMDGTNSLGTGTISTAGVGGVATFNVSSLAIGTHLIVAQYNDDATFAPSTSPTLTQLVKYATTTILEFSQEPANYGSPVTLIASVSSIYDDPTGKVPSGSVTFYHDSVAIGHGGVHAGVATFVATGLSCGYTVVTAVYKGDDSFLGGRSSPTTLIVNPAVTDTAVSFSANSSPLGAPLTIYVNVGGTVPPTGLVVLYDNSINSTAIGATSLSSGSGSITTSKLSIGAHNIIAYYNGDAHSATSTGSASVNISKASSSVSVVTSPNSASFNQNVTLEADVTGGTIAPSGSVDFYDGTTWLGSSSLDGGKAKYSTSFVLLGSRSITAVYSGDDNYNGNHSTGSVTISQAQTTTTLNYASGTPNDSVTLSATVTPQYGGTPTGDVVFYDGQTVLGTVTLFPSSNVATLDPHTFSDDGHVVWAAYHGDDNFAGSSSPQTPIAVSSGSAVTSYKQVLIASGAGATEVNGAFYYQNANLYTHIQTDTNATTQGDIALIQDTTSHVWSISLIGGNPGYGYGTYYTAAGDIFSQSSWQAATGDHGFGVAPGPILTVGLASSTTTLAALPSASVSKDQNVTLVATVNPRSGFQGSPTGVVTFNDSVLGSLGTATIFAGNATFTISALDYGTHQITAVYPGDPSFSGSSGSVSVVVESLTPSLSLKPSADSAYVGQPVTFTASVSGTDPSVSLNGSLTFSIDNGDFRNPDSGSTSSYTTTFRWAGRHSITVKYSGDTNYSDLTDTISYEVDKITPDVSLSASAQTLLYGQTVDFAAYVTSTLSGTIPEGTVNFTGGAFTGSGEVQSSGEADWKNVSFPVGDYAVIASYGGDNSFNPNSSSPIDVIVNQDTTHTTLNNPTPVVYGQPATIVATVAGDHSFEYPSGKVTFYDNHTSIGTADLANGTATFSETTLAAGDHGNITAEYVGNDNFEGSTSDATDLTINQASTTVHLNGINIQPLVGQQVTLSATVSATSPGAGSPTGTVTFTIGSSNLKPAPVQITNGVATLVLDKLELNGHSITATYDGDPNFKASSPSNAVNVVVYENADVRAKAGGDPVGYVDGAVQIDATDLSEGGFTGSWGVNRNWTQRTSLVANNIYGNGWENSFETFLQNPAGQSESTPSTIIGLSSAYQQVEFSLTSGSSGTYVANEDSTDSFSHSGSYFTWLDSSTGSTSTYYDFNSSTPAYLQGKLSSKSDVGGDSVTLTYDDSGNLTRVDQTDAAGDVGSFVYAYLTSGPNLGKISTISETIQRAGDSAPSTVRQAVYAYYGGTTVGGDAYGNLGDLQTVTTKDGGGNILSESYYRYYTPADIAANQQGYVGGLKYVFSDESFIKVAAQLSSGFVGFTVADSAIAPYADLYYRYDSTHRVNYQIVGSAGASSAIGQGTYSFDYTSNPSYSSSADGTIDFNQWFTKTVETQPDGNPNIIYTNAEGNVLLSISQVVSDPVNPSNEGKNWITASQFDAKGHQITAIATSAIVSSFYNLSNPSSFEGYSDLGITEGGVSFNSGLITTSTYTPNGYVQADYVQQGSGGTPIIQDFYTYTSHADHAGDTIYLKASQAVYRNADGTGAQTTTYSYAWYSGTNQFQSVTTAYPTINTSQNGPGIGAAAGAADAQTVVYDLFGRPVWTRDADGYISYIAYDTASGGVVQTIADFNTASPPTLINDAVAIPSDWTTPTGGGLNLVTTDQVDNLGRTTKETSPAGNVTYYAYDDVARAVFVFSGATLWLDGSGNGTLTTAGPIVMTRSDIPYSYPGDGSPIEGLYNETLTFSGTVTVSAGQVVLPGFLHGNSNHFNGAGNVLNLTGNGNSSNPQYTIQSLSRSLYNASGRTEGQLVESDHYSAITNSAYLGTDSGYPYSSGTYNATKYAYDVFNRIYKSTDANGTISETLYDGMGRAVSSWIGTDDSTTSGDFNGHNANQAAGNNMTRLTIDTYDGGNVGDGNLTQATGIVDSNPAHDRVSLYDYDWRDRLTSVKSGAAVDLSSETDGAARPIVVSTLDNLGEVVAVHTFDGDGVSMSDTNADGVPDALASSLLSPGAASDPGLTSYATTAYDDQGRAYSTSTYPVDPATGAIGLIPMTSGIFFDHRGHVIESVSSSGLATKTQYDGAGRPTFTYTTDAGAVHGNALSWANASSVAGDVVLSQTQLIYDADGNVIETIHKDRFSTDSATATGSLGDVNGTNGPAARTSYTASYYDASDRDISDVNIGTHGGAAWTRPSSVPARSDTALVTSTTYNAAGEVDTVTDPRGIVSKSYYDALGQVLYTVDAWDGYYTPIGGTHPSSGSANQTTAYTYDADSHTTTMTAVEPSGEIQATQYVYGVSPTNGSSFTSNDVLLKVEYPDASTGAASTTSTGQVGYTYNAAGEILTKTDQNETVHTYTYDSLGRQTLDSITTLGSGVAGTIFAVGTTYNAQGQVATLTNYSSTTADPAQIVNQVERTYTGLGQLAVEYQSHSGAVDANSTPAVSYTYSSPANGSRLISMTYPNGRIEHYGYDGSTLDNAIGRLSYIADDNGGGGVGAQVEAYQYLGLSIVVTQTEGNGVIMTLLELPILSTNADAGDMVTGLDRFGRMIDQVYITGSGTITSCLQYSYDRDGNVIVKANLLDSSLSETYTYDNLNRIASTTRGGSAYQSWNLDSVGNASSVTTTGTTQTRTTDALNQLTSIGSVTLTYDHNGNTTTDDQGHHLVYDAWNRLVTVKTSAGTTITTYGYDGIGRRITESPNGGTTSDLYYSSKSQIIEERKGTTTYQTVYGATYVNAIVLRDTAVSGTATLRLYAQQDNTYNVTALTDATGTVLQRYQDDEYGKVTILNADFSTASTQTTIDDWKNLYQGEEWDATVKLYNFDARVYSTSMETFLQADPMGYVNGASREAAYFAMEGGVDPSGTFFSWAAAGAGAIAGGLIGSAAGAAGSIATSLLVNNSWPTPGQVLGAAASGGISGAATGAVLGGYGTAVVDPSAAIVLTVVGVGAVGGGAGGAAGSVIQQAVDNHGVINGSQVAISARVGAAAGAAGAALGGASAALGAGIGGGGTGLAASNGQVLAAAAAGSAVSPAAVGVGASGLLAGSATTAVAMSGNSNSQEKCPLNSGVRSANDTSIVEREAADWSIVKQKTGETRWEHLQRHAVDQPARPGLHGVFDNDPVLTTQEAWYRGQRLGITPSADGTYVIPMGRRIGWEGGSQGIGQPLENITIHTVDGNKIITAYPSR